MLGLYFHFPFCECKCFYCDFPSQALRKQNAEEILLKYGEALKHEIKLRTASLPPQELTSIYLGGGTPSLFPLSLLGELFHLLYDKFIINSDCEITIEANPNSLSLEKLQFYRQLGINRLSIGVQTTHDLLLQAIGRCHCQQDVINVLHWAKKVGFSNISADLMYGLPGQTLSMLQESIYFLIKENIPHISIYGLQIEPQTVFAKRLEQGKLVLPDEEIIETMYDTINHILPENHYERYEISNYALTGFYSKHNYSYWQDRPYWGFGVAAHSYWQKRRFFNTSQLSTYLSALKDNQLPQETEEIVTYKHWMEEFCFLALRTAKGIDKGNFLAKFHIDIHAIYGAVIAKLIKKKLLIETESNLFLSPLGMKYGNQVFSEFLLS